MHYVFHRLSAIALSIKDHPELSRKCNGVILWSDLATDTHNFNHPIVDLLYMGLAWNSKYCAIQQLCNCWQTSTIILICRRQSGCQLVRKYKIKCWILHVKLNCHRHIPPTSFVVTERTDIETFWNFFFLLLLFYILFGL